MKKPSRAKVSVEGVHHSDYYVLHHAWASIEIVGVDGRTVLLHVQLRRRDAVGTDLDGNLEFRDGGY